MRRKILFVDDEPMVLQGLRRMLRGMRGEWDMSFAGSGEEALQLLESGPFDVVVSDMRMPGMNGAQLLGKVMERFPEIVRIVLSGHSDRQLILQSTRVAHQYLSKPCEADTLRNTVARACALRDLLMDDTLKGVVSEIGVLPSLPALYVEIMAELQKEESSMKKVADIISSDVSMTAKILQMVNSAFFAMPRHIENIAQAVNLLGLETVKALVLSAQIFSQFEKNDLFQSSMEKLWRHSMATGAFAKSIATEKKADKKSIDDAFLAGMLHDVGKLVFSMGFPEKYHTIVKRSWEEGISLGKVEYETLGTGHGAVGAYLMGLWGFADDVVEAIAFHNEPGKCPARTMCVLAAVHAANALEHAAGPGGIDMDAVRVDRAFLSRIGVAEKLGRWAQACQTPIR
jgi:putative nucleotidyltransferase with HDIG domain